MKIIHWIYLSIIPAFLGCTECIANGVTSKALLGFLSAYLILFFLWLFKGYYFKEELENGRGRNGRDNKKAE